MRIWGNSLPRGTARQAIIAAARVLRCHRLCSEDMTHGREIDGVTIFNTF
jgi:predicted nucleic acid-binding protein